MKPLLHLYVVYVLTEAGAYRCWDFLVLRFKVNKNKIFSITFLSSRFKIVARALATFVQLQAY